MKRQLRITEEKWCKQKPLVGSSVGVVGFFVYETLFDLLDIFALIDQFISSVWIFNLKWNVASTFKGKEKRTPKRRW